jgi:hypothetical protein
MNNHKLYLYRPGGTASDFLGELLVDNLNVNIKLHEMSNITFTIPETINNIANTRLDEVLDGYIVELWYGQVDGVYNPPSQKDFEKIRFILHKTPLDFNDFKRIYSYEGYSIESNLELRQITNWPGVFVPDFYRSITYDNSTPNRYTEVAATGETIPNHPYSVTAKTTPSTGKYIKIAPTTATATPLDIYIYEVRENTDPSDKRYNEIAYVRYTGTTYDESGFKQGYYFLDLDTNEEYVEYIYIYVPDNYDDFDGQSGAAYKKLRFKVYDNPISRHYAIGVNRNSENPFTQYYIDLAQDVEDGGPAEYGNYTFTSQEVRSKNGLKLEHALLGNIQTRDISDNIDNNSLTEDGLLYNTDFTIGAIDPVVAAKYRSNLEFNNTTVYQAVRDIAESFDAIAVFDTIAKTVSFYPENATTWPNNGLILKYGTYLKSISKDIDASKIVTAAKAVGKDNSGIELITPDGNDYWEDFSYYLDEFYIDKDKSLTDLYNEGFDFTLENNLSTGGYYLGISYPDSDNTSFFESRWMDAAEAKKLAKWQFNRDFLHNVLLGEFLPSDVDGSIGINLTPMNRFYDLYNLRSEAINEYVQSDTVLSARKAEYFRYKNLYDFYEKRVTTQVALTGSADPTDEQRYLYYKVLWQDAQTAVTAQETFLENERLKIFESTIADSIGDKLNEVRSVLNKSTIFSIDLDKLKSFIKESVVTDSKLDNDFDLLEAVITHVNENKIPRITLNVGIVNILAAQESYDDWNKLRVGDLVNVYFPEFNIDEEIQIREVTIDFEQHTASLVIASVRTYNKSRANYVSKSVKQLLRANKNNLNNIEDFSRVTNTESEQTYATLNGGTINTTNTVIAFGATDSSGEYGNTISGSGGSLLVVSDVDPLTETFNFSSNKSLFILDGAIQSFYDAGTHITQVEVSGENGFVIRKITGSVEDEDLSVVEQVYIDTDGNATFSGTLSAPLGNIGGFKITQTTIQQGDDTTKLALQSNGTDPSITIGQAINGYNNNGIFLGLQSTNPAFSILKQSLISEITFEETFTFGSTMNLSSGSGVWTTSDPIFNAVGANPTNARFNIENTVTTSANTGPLEPYQGTRYIYYESSSTSTAETYLIFTYNTTTTTTNYLKFYYHMFGESTTKLNVYRNGTTEVLWSRSGNKGNSWFEGNVVIPSGTTSIRFGVIGDGSAFTSDIALDHIRVYSEYLGMSYDTNFGLNIAGSVTATSGQIGGFFIDGNTLNSTNAVLSSGNSPYIYFGSDSTPAYGDEGAFLGIVSSVPKFSLVSGLGVNDGFLKYDPSATYDLEIAGNAKIGPLLIGNDSTAARSLTLANDGFTVYTLNGGQSSVIDATNEFFEFIFESIKIGSLITGFSFTASNTSTSRPYTVTLFLGNDSIATITGTVANGSNVVNFSSKTYFITRIRLTLGVNFDGSTSIFASDCTINGFKALITVNDFFVSENGDIYSDEITLGTAARDKINIKGRNGGTSSRSISLTPAVLDGDRTITLPDVTGTAAIISENNTASTEFKVGRYTAAIGIDTRVTITFSTAFPTGLTYGVIVTPHGTNGMSLSGSNYLFGAESISNTGFTFVNDGIAAAAANGFSWIAFAY